MKKIKYLKFSIPILFIFFFIIWGCAPTSIKFTGGEKIDQEIKNKKVTIAVLPTINWSEDEGFCRGYFLYGLFGALTRKRAYSEGGVVVTNALTSALWKKNRMKLVKKDKLITAIKEANLKPEEIFPKQDYSFCGLYPRPVQGPQNVGSGVPNYDRLYDLGKTLGADIVIISRLSRNTQTNYCAQDPLGIEPPLTTIINVADYIYKNQIKKYRNNYLAIDIMALDVNKREVLGFGYYNRDNFVPQSNKKIAMEQYAKALTFYVPKPANEDLEKEFLAQAGGYAATVFANYILQNTIGVGIPLVFKFNYTYGDETWKMYGPNYFKENYEITQADYNSMFH